jgi:hypothetical protein
MACFNRRTNLHEETTNKLRSSSNIQPIVAINATFTMPIDKNNENIPPHECKSPVKIPKIRKKEKMYSLVKYIIFVYMYIENKNIEK